MEILILCGIYLVELACYCLGLRILFEVHYRTKVWMALGILVPVVVGVLPIDVSGKNVFVTVSVICIMFLMMEEKVIEKGIWLILSFLLLECIYGIFVNPCERILSFVDSNYNIAANYFVVKCCTVVSILFLNVIKEKIYHKKTHINSSIYLIIGIIAFSMMFCLTVLNHVKIFLVNRIYIFICDILNVAILISIFLLVIFIIYIKTTHERMEQLLKTEQILKESQVSYYKQILKKETDTRKYRHDMVNHLIYVQDILSKNKIDEAQIYLASMLGGFKKIQNTYYIIGNEMVETIMNYYFAMLPKSVIISINGRSPVDFDIEDTDVCTIFSNLFQNIVEEIIENNLINAKIVVEVQKGKQFVEYEIKNSISFKKNQKIIDKNGLPKSHKKDKKNHGIGMVNVKEAIERCHGKFVWNQNDGYFIVNIILPIK